RYVLRRGALITVIVTGLTLLIGSLLGGAVRDADRVVVPGPGEAPRNQLPGSPLPSEPGKREKRTPAASGSPTQGATSAAPTPGAAATPGATQGTTTAGTPSQPQGATGGGQAPPQQTAPAQQAPATSAGPTSGGTTGGGDSTPGGTGGSGG